MGNGMQEQAVDLPPLAERGPSRLCRNLILLLIAVGVTCRLVQYLAAISFWHDEACLVLNVMDKTPRQLVGALNYDQTAPPLFLLALKGSAQWLGYTEYGLRLVPQLMALLSLPLFAWLAWRLLAPAAAAWAVALLALSPDFIMHGAEVKQYSGDVLAALVLWTVALAPRRPASDALRLAMLAWVSAGLIWFSEASLFVFGGIALVYLPRIIRGRPVRGLKYLACVLPVLVSFAALYWISMKPQQTGNLYAYWTDHDGLPDYSHPLRLLVWPFKSLLQLHNYAFEPWGPINLGLSVLGVWVLAGQKRRPLLGILLAPVALTFLAALAGRYPFGGSRVTLFLMPAVLLLMGVGLTNLHRLPHPTLRKWAWVLPALLLGGGLVQGAYFVAFPRNQSHLRPVVQYVREHRRPGQPIYVPTGISWVEFQCYWRRPDPPLVLTPENIEPLERAERFWLVFEFDPAQGLKKREKFLQQARSIGVQEDQFIIPGGAAYLFHRTSPVDAHLQ